MQKASPGVASKLPSSFPHAAHSAAEAGVLKDALEWERTTVVALWMFTMQAAPRLGMSLPWTPVLNQ